MNILRSLKFGVLALTLVGGSVLLSAESASAAGTKTTVKRTCAVKKHITQHGMSHPTGQALSSYHVTAKYRVSGASTIVESVTIAHKSGSKKTRSVRGSVSGAPWTSNKKTKVFTAKAAPSVTAPVNYSLPGIRNAAPIVGVHVGDTTNFCKVSFQAK